MSRTMDSTTKSAASLVLGEHRDYDKGVVVPINPHALKYATKRLAEVPTTLQHRPPGPAEYSPNVEATGRHSPSFPFGTETRKGMGRPDGADSPAPGEHVGNESSLGRRNVTLPNDESVPPFPKADRYYEYSKLYKGNLGHVEEPDYEGGKPGPGQYHSNRATKRSWRANAMPFYSSPERTTNLSPSEDPGPGAYPVQAMDGPRNQADSRRRNAPAAAFSRASRNASAKMYHGMHNASWADPENPGFSYSPVTTTLSKSGGASFGTCSPRKYPPRFAEVQEEQRRREAAAQASLARLERAKIKRTSAGQYSWLHGISDSKQDATGNSPLSYTAKTDGAELGNFRHSAPSHVMGTNPRFQTNEFMAHNPNQGREKTDSPGPIYKPVSYFGKSGPSARIPKGRRLVETPRRRAARDVPGPGMYDITNDDYDTDVEVLAGTATPSEASRASPVRFAPISSASPKEARRSDGAESKDGSAGGTPRRVSPVRAARSQLARPSPARRTSPRKYGKLAKMPSAPSAPFSMSSRDITPKIYGGSNDFNKEAIGRQSPGPAYAVPSTIGRESPSYSIPKEARGFKEDKHANKQGPDSGYQPDSIESRAEKMAVGASFTRGERIEVSLHHGFEHAAVDVPGPIYDVAKSSFGNRYEKVGPPSISVGFTRAKRVLNDVPSDAAATPGPGAHNPKLP